MIAVRHRGNKIDEALLQDAQAFFLGVHRFAIGKLGYLRMKGWSEVASTHEDPEVALFKKLIADGAIPKGEEFCHLGVGDKSAREAKLYETFKATGAEIFVGFDIARTALHETTAEFAANFKDVIKYEVATDIFKAFHAPIRLENPVFFCDGITLGNSPSFSSEETLDEGLIRTFAQVRNAMQHRGHLVFTMEEGSANPTLEEIDRHVSAYRNPANDSFTRSVVDIMREDLALEGLTRDQTSYMPTWDRQGAVNLGLLIDESTGNGFREITIGGRSRIDAQEGKLLYTNRSARIDEARTVRLLEAAGFHDIKAYRVDPKSTRIAFIAAAQPSC